MKIQRTPRVPEPALKDALPLGTVISVREQPDQKYMLIGYATDIKPYAYYAVQWPQGFIDDDSVFLVERYDVSGVVGRGLKDTESQLFIKVYDKHACSVYSRIYVFCSGHEEFCAEGQPHLIYENSYVIVNKAGDTYKVPYPFDGDRYIASLNKDSDETQQLNAMQRLFFWTEYKKHIEIE